MNPDRWQEIERLYHAALERPESQRGAFLEEACGDDSALRDEVESLLAEGEHGANFIESPALEVAAKVLAKDESLLGGTTKGDGGSHVEPNFLQPPTAAHSSPETATASIPAFAPGATLANRFRIVRLIAHGGMGEVYEAKDLELGERVALKTVRPRNSFDKRALARFKKEVQLARRVTHPNVCRIFDLARHQLPPVDPGCPRGEVVFLTMELLQGETLAARLARMRRMTATEALPIVQQMAEALAAAHAVGVVHRDFKPGNVMLVTSSSTGRATQRAVVTDFGLAMTIRLDGLAPDSERRSSVSESGQLAGTLGYMAPEQFRGGEITPATDVYAFGVVMYEMLAGKRPTSPHASIPSLDPKWDGLIARCLEADSTKRFADAGEILAVLLGEATPQEEGPSRGYRDASAAAVQDAHAHPASIAILPFVNMSPDPANDYFGDGLAEELINSLTQIKELRVVARTSAFQFRGRQIDIRQIGKQLNVTTILEGGVRKSGQKIRITAQLTNVADGYELWAGRYDREMKDLFAIQDEIADAIARELKIELVVGTGQVRPRRHGASVANYNLYLEGRYFWNKRTEQDIEAAIDCFKRANALDPSFALPLAGLADAYLILGVSGLRAPQEVMPLAKESAVKALALDEALPEALTSLACVRALFDWDWRGAEGDFKRAINLSPWYVSAHQWYATNLLAPLGRFGEAHSEIDLAHELDPLSLPIAVSCGLQFFYEREYDRAIGKYLEALRMDQYFGLAHYFLGQAYTQKGMHQDAVRELHRADQLTGSSPEVISALGHAYAVAGEKNEALKQLDRLVNYSQHKFVSPVLSSQIFVGLKEKERAFESLERGFQLRSVDMVWLAVRPAFDHIRADARYIKLCELMGLREDKPRLDLGTD